MRSILREVAVLGAILAPSLAFGQTYVESFPNPMEGWTTRWLYQNSNFRNYYTCSGQPESYRGNNPEGAWVGCTNSYTFNHAFGDSINHMEMYVSCFSAATFFAKDKNGVQIYSVACSGGSFGFRDQFVSFNSSAGVSEWGFVGGNIQGSTAIDEVKVIRLDNDNDGIGDSGDNCPTVPNPDQANFDGDSQGDACDANDDNDPDPDTSDCNDNNTAIYTGAPESCDLIDSNCNGSLVDTFANFDGDSEPDCVDANDDNDSDPDTTDCNDNSTAIYTGAPESCDAIDSNCNGSLVDTFANFDSDSEPDCIDANDDNDPDPDTSDCNDANTAIYTGAPESCDTIDSNCNGSLVDTFANFDSDSEPDCIDANDDNDPDPDTSDCNDNSAAIYTGAPESCDAIDSNCNGSLVDTFANFDSDTQPDCIDLNDDNDPDPDVSDCNDNNIAIYTGAPESCDAIDSNCNGSLVDTFANFDSDTEPDCIDANDDNDPDPDVSDCNDASAAIYTGAPESCDTIDSNCNGSLVDTFANFDSDTEPDCIDLNDDNDPDPDVSDCNDNNIAIYTGAAESCDAIDSNCNGSLVDTFPNFDADTEPDCIDLNDDNDADPDTTDCNDANPAIYTGAPELCDAIDSNCNTSLVDTFANFDGDADPDCIDLNDDNDSDPDVTDCDDTNANVYTGAPELCDAIDSNCDASLVDGFADFDEDAEPDCVDADDDGDDDDDLTDCDDANATIYTGAAEACDDIDSDCNGSLVDNFTDFDDDETPDCTDDDDDDDGDLDIDDCNDANADISQFGVETCNDIDDDCDGEIDGAGSVDAIEVYVDADLDGYGDPEQATATCVLGEGVSDNDDDCDDTSNTINPDADEVYYDGVDANCDGLSDNDADQDGADSDEHGGTDCDDTNDTVYVGAPELADGLDNDCNGEVEDDDADGDGLSNVEEDEIGSDPEEPDTDGDGVPDGLEVPDVDDVLNTDGDADPDFDDTDDDGDGILTSDEIGDWDWTVPNTEPPDGDGDGTPDYLDTDSDGDGIPDADESHEDLDGDGIPDYADVDADGDGFEIPDDCDDMDETVNPDAVDVGDGIDNDCDGSIDNGGATDGDNDGFSAEDGDCDDSDADVFPGALEACDDGTDNNCDGAADEGCPDVDDEGGCGCATGSQPSVAWLFVGLAGLLARRRRS